MQHEPPPHTLWGKIKPTKNSLKKNVIFLRQDADIQMKEAEIVECALGVSPCRGSGGVLVPDKEKNTLKAPIKTTDV